jgi:hypothetical protein
MAERPATFYGKKALKLPEYARLGRVLQQRLSNARVFRLSDDYTRLAQEVSYSSPGRIWNALQSAILPYEEVWLEWNQAPRNEVVRVMNSTTAFRREADDTVANGALLGTLSPNRFRADLFSLYEKTDKEPEHVWYWPHELVWDIEDPLPAHFSVPDGKETIEIGSYEGVSQDPHPISKDYYRYAREGAIFEMNAAEHKALDRIFDRTGVTVNPIFGAYADAMMKNDTQDRMRSIFDMSLRETKGDLRFIICALALLQEKWVVAEPSRVRAGRRIAGGRLMKYLDHHTLTIVAPKERRLKLAERALTNIGRRRRHEVHEHWCYRSGTGRVDCVHTYVSTGVRGKQLCVECGSERWRRKAHERGDATIGYAKKDYEVRTPT